MVTDSSRDTGWFKSSHSGGGNDSCVEVRLTDRATVIRDTKNRTAGLLHLPNPAFAALIAGIRS